MQMHLRGIINTAPYSVIQAALQNPAANILQSHFFSRRTEEDRKE